MTSNNQGERFLIVKLGKLPIGGSDRITEQPPPAGFHTRATSIHPPVRRSKHCSVHSAKTVRKAAFPLHSYAIHSTQSAASQLQSALFPIFSLPFHLSLAPSHCVCLSPRSSGKTADRCGRRRDRWRGWQEETFGGGNENQKMWRKRMNPAHKHTHFDFYAASHINYNDAGELTLTHTVHMPSIISLFDALALRLIGMPESVTAYNITMMEMSLSGSVLWVTCVLVAKIEFRALISYTWQCIYTVRCTHVQHTHRRQICTCKTHTRLPHGLACVQMVKHVHTGTHFCPSLVLISVKAQCHLWTGHWLLYLIKVLYIVKPICPLLYCGLSSGIKANGPCG